MAEESDSESEREKSNQRQEDEETHRSREKLRGWQNCQVAKGFVDNTINRVLENYITMPPNSYRFEDPWYHLLQGNRIEDRAVSMAIHNHGIFPSLDSSTPSSSDDNNVPNTSDGNGVEVKSNSQETKVDAPEIQPNSSLVVSMGEPYDYNQPEDFLDRAVAEAIKKKGLSTLSVNYG